MKKLFATYEIAKKLKELGFDEPCLGRWNRHAFQDGKIVPDVICIITPKNSEIANSSLIAAPTWGQAIDWIDEHNIKVVETLNSGWEVGTFHTGIMMYSSSYTLPTKEQAILKAIELITKK